MGAAETDADPALSRPFSGAGTATGVDASDPGGTKGQLKASLPFKGEIGRVSVVLEEPFRGGAASAVARGSPVPLLAEGSKVGLLLAGEPF